MKKVFSLLLIISLVAMIGCKGKTTGKKDTAAADTTSVPDTGFTGIKKMMSGQYVVSEITFKNGVRDGLMKTFYQGGQLRYTFWYVNGLKQDSARWYYVEGQLFRTTPYKNDTIDGIQKQYYRTGKLRARIGFSKGMRIPYLEEFDGNGKRIGGYPEIVVKVTDDYKTAGLYRIGIEMSDKNNKAKFYRGDFVDGRFDTAHLQQLPVIEGRANITLRKSGTQGAKSVSVVGEVTSPLGNKYLTNKKIDLPYNDLK